MAPLYGRKWRLVAGPEGQAALEVTQLRVAFRIDRSHDKPEANAATLDVYNLSPNSRARLSEALDKRFVATLEAGYEGAFPMLFKGRIARVWHRRAGPDWLTSLEADDGAQELGRRRIRQAFAPGTQLQDVFLTLSKKFGVGIGNALQQFRDGNFRRGLKEFSEGLVLSGSAKDILDQLVQTAGLEYSVQNGSLVVTPRGEALPGQVVVLSRDQGLIGSPQAGEKGLLRATALIQPGLEPPRTVRLQAQNAQGLYRIQRVLYEGDTRANPWYATLDLKRIP